MKVSHPVPASVPSISRSPTVPVSRRQRGEIYERLSSALRGWCSRESADWDAQVERSRPGAVPDDTDSELWDSMPTIDSKAVARTSPIFEEHLGRPLDIRLIRAGGYQSADHMIRHLVPAMMDGSPARGGVRAVKLEDES